TQVAGERGTLEVLRQMQGFEIPANAWERQVLARRIVDYDPAWLDQLCLTGAVGGGRLSPHPATVDGAGGGNGDAPAGRQGGASFFADIVRGTGKLKAEIETGLWELVAAGLVTADGFDNLRALIDPKRRGG